MVITRSPGRSFTSAARAAGVARVIIDETDKGRLGRIEARMAARYVRFRLRDVDLAVVLRPQNHDAGKPQGESCTVPTAVTDRNRAGSLVSSTGPCDASPSNCSASPGSRT